MILLEFTVLGPPRSHQSHDKAGLAAWREKVRTAAAKVWGSRSVLRIPVLISVTYYHEGESVRIDNDNLIKPVQDALIGLIYEDDRFVTDTLVRKTSIDGSFRIRFQPLVLLRAFSHGGEFLHVRVQQAPSHETPIK
jgi:crossover junction endodeoxyribonuclease RusA